jgi:hypothetical protein
VLCVLFVFFAYFCHNTEFVHLPLGTANINACFQHAGLPGCFTVGRSSNMPTCEMVALWKAHIRSCYISSLTRLFDRGKSVCFYSNKEIVSWYTLYRVCINYRRISLHHNLSRKCRKIVKFVSITHSERDIWNGPIIATAISREKRKLVLEGNGCLTDRA